MGNNQDNKPKLQAVAAYNVMELVTIINDSHIQREDILNIFNTGDRFYLLYYK